MNSDDPFMLHALNLARRARDEGEVPVGAVVVAEGEIIGEGWNRPITSRDPSAHAEIQALRSAGDRMGNYRLPGAVLYVTLEPCVMCAGAIFQARLAEVVFGAFDPKAGAAGGVVNLFEETRLNHHTRPRGGVMQEECAALLRDFFRERRRP